MPYKSKAQRAYFHTNKSKLELQGVNVDEWDKTTGNKPLPDRKGKTRTQKSIAKLSRAMKGRKR